MQVHIAIYRWKESIKEEQLNKALAMIEALEKKIPGIVEISSGKNQSKYSEGYTHVILVRGKNEAALAEYRAHPDHENAATIIESMEEHGIGIDFQTKANKND